MMLKNWLALLTAVFIGLSLAVISIVPPSPQGLDTPDDQFSSARAMVDVRMIAAAPHPTGSEENAKVRTYLAGQLTALGMDVDISASTLPEKALARLNRWSGQSKTEQPIYNVIGVLPGADRTKPALLLMAHHDTVWASPGSADDTVGIASILEIVRAVNETGQPARDLIVLFTDGEEVGLSGARHFFSENPLRNKVGAVINFEARGGGGTANLFQTSEGNGDAARLFARAVRQPSGNSAATYIYRILPNDTDLTPALKGDYAAYNIANIGKAEYYHSPKIDADALSESTVQHMGSQGLDLTRALLSADGFPRKKPDATFFDLFGLWTVIYAPVWGWAFLGVTLLCYILPLRRDMLRKDTLVGAVKMVGFMVIGGVVLFGLNALSGGGSGADYYDRLAAIPRLEAVAGLTIFAVFFGTFGRSQLSENGVLGATLPLFILAVAGQSIAPTATYFISLTVLLCAIATFIRRSKQTETYGQWISAAVAAILIGYMVSFGHLLMLGVGPDLPSVAILPAALAVLAILPLWRGLPKRVVTVASIASLGLAIAIALWIRLDPIASTVPLY